MEYQLFETPESMAELLAQNMLEISKQARTIHISLSGGSTPKQLFKKLAQPLYSKRIKWQNLHFWWGDERCVAPEDPESNYGEANQILFKNIDLPQANIHRIRGEEEPESEALRYAEEMKSVIPNKYGMPVFDWIILGIGTDGHTASLFPNQTNFGDSALSVVAKHPESGQLRISKTARLLANANRITYLVLGESKAEVLKKIQQTSAEELPYPAAHIKSTNGQTEWYIDSQAANLLP